MIHSLDFYLSFLIFFIINVFIFNSFLTIDFSILSSFIISFLNTIGVFYLKKVNNN